MTVTVELREVDSTLIATFDDPVPGTITSKRHAVGGASVAWQMARNSAVFTALEDAGDLLTWETGDVELWVFIDGELTHRGPIYRHSIDFTTGWITTYAHDCTGYLWRLDQGRGERFNWFTAGEMAVGLPGWAAADGASIAANTTDPYIVGGRSMDITGPGSASALSETLPAIAFVGVVHMAFVLKYIGATWPNGEAPNVGFVIHETQPSGGGAWTVAGSSLLQIPGSTNPTENWIRVEHKHRREANLNNRYRVAFAQPGTTTRIGEGLIDQAENVSARAGQDPSLFAASLFQHLIDSALTGWTRSVSTTGGPVLAANVRSDHADHPDVPALLRQLENWGEWRVRPNTFTYPVLYFYPTPIYTPDYTFTPADTSGMVLDVDASDATTEALFLADGQDAPTREEGYSTGTIPGALLMTTQMGPPGMIGRDLDVIADKFLTESDREVRRWSFTPASGPFGEAKGHWPYYIEVGDLALVSTTTPIARSDTVMLDSWSLEPVSDVWTAEWETL